MVLLPGFSSQGSTGPIEKLKGGHEGENRSQFSDTVNSMFYSSYILSSKTDVQCLNDNLLFNIIFLLLVLLIL